VVGCADLMLYRDVEELLAERGIEVDHVTLYRWVQRFTPLLVDAARMVHHDAPGAPARDCAEVRARGGDERGSTKVVATPWHGDARGA